jgi:hypothetical protein
MKTIVSGIAGTAALAALALGGAVVGGALTSAVGLNAAREFRLVDSAGHMRAVLGMTSDGPGLALFDSAGKVLYKAP